TCEQQATITRILLHGVPGPAGPYRTPVLGKEDSYERNPSGVSFVFNHHIFKTFMKVLKMPPQLVKKNF
ncbi:MAG: hypothetical protein U0O47_09025, partial [Oscillospiraceae bacterium]